MGYHIVEARDLDEAMAIAARMPTARSGSVEVRPLQQVACEHASGIGNAKGGPQA